MDQSGTPINKSGTPINKSGTPINKLGAPMNQLGAHTGAPLPTVVQWFKTMTTNAYIRAVKNRGWQPFHRKLWQRNYYEHIIRDDHDYERIVDYIRDNQFTKTSSNPYNRSVNKC